MAANQNPQLRSLLLGGVLPVVIYTIVEEYYGVLWGLVCGMVLGVFEIVFEKIRHGRVDTITWVGNGMLLGLGGISLVTQEGIWFKLQPSILEAGMAVLLVGSCVMGKPFLTLMAKKQGMFEKFPAGLAPVVERAFKGMTFRIGVFFLLHALLAGWAALYWSTRAWAILKGVGFTVTLVVYMFVEVIFLRLKIRASNETLSVARPRQNGQEEGRRE